MNDSQTFCEDPLWDLNLTWLTDNPDFTTCFHQTVLVYLPAVLLLLLTPYQIWICKISKDRLIPLKVPFLLKIGFNVILMLLPIIGKLGVVVSIINAP